MSKEIRVLLLSLSLTIPAFSQKNVDPNIPKYQSSTTVLGTLNAIGCESMEPLLLVWADEFSKLHPGFHLEVKSSDSAAAPKALISGLASLGPMSREMTSEEVAAFEKRFSYAPTRVLVALDPLGVFVNAGNPLSKLGMDQLDAIYSKSRNAGYKKVTTWGDLGLTEDFKKQPIEVFDQATASTARRFFQETVLQKGDFKPGIKPITGAFGASDVVATNLFAISYGPVNFATSNNVKTLPLIPIGMTMAVEPTLDNIQKRLYPLTRMFFIYINKTPGKPLPPVVSEFLSFIFSREGQIQVENIGSVPLPAGVLNGNRGRIMN